MAENKPWCLTEDSPFSDYEGAAKAYLEEFEKIHNKITNEEWSDILL